MGVEPYLVAASLRGVLSQRLVRRLCPRCRRRVADGGAAPFEACGCPACTEGYKGRVGVFEMMLCNEAVAELIRGGTCGTDALRLAAADGYFPMADDALAKMDAGVTDFFEIAGVLAE